MTEHRRHLRSRSGKVRTERVTMAHGAGGRSMHDLIDDVFLTVFGGGTVSDMNDSALIAAGDGDLAFTSDSFVVNPVFFPGGDIGKLAVCGTVNDLAVAGARPVALSFSVIIEEGFAIADIRRIAASAAAAADEAGVQIVTGDTKVVNRGAVDGIFINTAGVGRMVCAHSPSPAAIEVGDKIIVSGSIGEHGAAVMVARGDLGLESDLVSDCRPLVGLCGRICTEFAGLRVMRDATRGGVAAVLNEFALASDTALFIDEARLPLKPEVRGVSEILGLDPLYLANEGLFVLVIDKAESDAAVDLLRQIPGGEAAAMIGEVRTDPAGALVMNTALGGQRLVDLPDGEQLPRIC